jgi:hypothetical protein
MECSRLRYGPNAVRERDGLEKVVALGRRVRVEQLLLECRDDLEQCVIVAAALAVKAAQ